MAARSRPRAGQLKEDFDEERSIWSQIRDDAKRVDALMVQSNTTSKKIVELTAQQTALKERGEPTSNSIDADLEKLLRENIRLSEEIEALISSENGDSDLLSKLEILSALRNAQESEPSSASRATSVGKSQRDRQNKRKLTDTIDDRDSIAADSPGGHSSPKVMVPSRDRLKVVSGGSRAGSVPAGRESSVKAEDVDSDQVKAPSEKQRLSVNSEVIYRDPKKRSLEDEGTLYRVTSVIGEGKQRRYEIIDADPDTPAQPFRASISHMVAIPPSSANITLPDLKTGRQVLALYPGTTTFYKAEVVAPWTAKKTIKEEGKDEAENLVRLRFEGEDEADREMSVERRYVLPDK
ncbi:hypothetical protein K491DRAFT_689937 [Lophiostoma macrostomum CBS 122681]|uniref:SGF29 C-terminal domain-containing protein n=1 Tax=Lophiostoma macrostomum CBS 122681 TaxID=1314788 RepID=A0A6A6TJ39_9PLEO|nr:hypothetical protein K491DRAFT_689937 [Lophiostoma macrostomum CBS 122681]